MITNMMVISLILCVMLVNILPSLAFSLQNVRNRVHFTNLHINRGNLVTNDELDAMKIDISKLSDKERERLEFIHKLTAEANELARVAGMTIEDRNNDQEMVERSIEETKWSGQSDMEKTYLSSNSWSDLLKRADLVVGDVAALTVFAIGGRLSHCEGIDPIDLFITAAPFVFCWLIISPLLGAYSREATSSRQTIAQKLLSPWAASISAALIARGLIKGYPTPTTFIGNSLAITFVTLFLWRTFYVYAFGETSDKECKQAGFFEVFKMIGTLIRRW